MNRFNLFLSRFCLACFLGTALIPSSCLYAQKITLAVVDFEGFGISQTEAIALTNRLRNEIFRLGTFDIVERGMMQSILVEQDFQLLGCTSNECLVEIGRLLGAQQMVGGSISRVEDIITVSARLIDVETGKLLRVSDHDFEGSLRHVLTQGMGEVAARLSGLEAKETIIPPEQTQVVQTPVDQDQGETSQLDTRLSHIRRAPLVNIDGFYTYSIDGEQINTAVDLKRILKNSGDELSIRLYHIGAGFNVVGVTVSGSGIIVWILLDGGGEVGGIMTATGLVLAVIGDAFFIKPAVRRYNRLVMEGKVPVPAD